MLFTPPPGYASTATNRQSITGRGNAGIQSILTQPPPSFPGATSATGGVSGMAGMNPYASSYLPPSSIPQNMPIKPIGRGGGNANMLRTLMGGR